MRTPDDIYAEIVNGRRSRWAYRRFLRSDYWANLHTYWGLTKQQANVIKFLVLGYTNAEIAQARHRSLNTTKVHLKRIMERMETSNRATLIAKVYIRYQAEDRL